MTTAGSRANGKIAFRGVCPWTFVAMLKVGRLSAPGKESIVLLCVA